LKKLKVGIPNEYFDEGLDPAVQKAVQASLDLLKSKGATIRKISLPHTQYAISTYYLVAVSEASSNLARFDGVRFGVRPEEADTSGDLVDFYKKVRSRFGAEVKRRIILGTYALSTGYYDAYYKRACQVRRLIKEDFDQAFKKVDVIASPVSPVTAFQRGENTGSPLQMYLMDVFTIPASLAGVPAISLPCGEDEDKLPIGLQLIAPHFGEDRLLSIAHQLEAELTPRDRDSNG